MDTLIQAARTGRVLTITLNRPHQLNALNTEVLQLLDDQMRRVESDPKIGCVIVKGAGDRAFSAGADLDEIRDLSIVEAQAFIRQGHRTMSAIADSPVPVIAAVDGYALGGGFELMLACHITLASDRSSFGLPEARIGCIPGFGGTQRLTASVGKPVANLLLLTGERIDATRAWEAGLLSVPPCPPDLLMAEAQRVASLIASGSRTGLANLLDASRRSVAPPALAHEAALAAISIASADGQEGIAAFAERRPPVFHDEPS